MNNLKENVENVEAGVKGRVDSLSIEKSLSEKEIQELKEYKDSLQVLLEKNSFELFKLKLKLKMIKELKPKEFNMNSEMENRKDLLIKRIEILSELIEMNFLFKSESRAIFYHEEIKAIETLLRV